MTIVRGYSTLNTAKTRQGIRDIIDDPTLEMVITAVSRLIDDYCQRRFWSATETRVYSAPGAPYPYYTVAGPTFFTAARPTRIFIDDVLSVSALSTDDNGDRTYPTIWATTDYDLYPLNAASSDFGAQPYWEIRSSPLGNYRFPFTAQGIKVTGVFGYSTTTPPVVEEACLAQVALIMKAPDVASGSSGGGPIGTQVPGATGLHPFVRRMLDPYRRQVVG
jgi:hypothetical protein